ncbi:MAG: DUF2341 domain-containing protein, partial [Kiritimatiellaeota bacterium]|nr:DUF2341 domain-containing protein [Kiritimatiellota bacterium]
MFSASADAAQFDPTGFMRRMPITFGGYDGAEPLTNFPAFVKFDAGVAGDMREDGADLRFVDEKDQLLPHEIDTWDPSGVSAAWVKIPELTAETVIYAWWGKYDAQTPGNGADVWDDYAGVWHFNGEDGDLPDSTANQNHADRGGVTATNGVATGSQWFDGSKRVIIPHHESLNIAPRFTISFWLRYPDHVIPNTQYTRLFNKKYVYNDNGWEMEKADRTHNTFCPRGNGAGTVNISMPNGEELNNPLKWYQITVQYWGNNQGALYVNGVNANPSAPAFGTSASDNIYDLIIGGYRNNGTPVGGYDWFGFVDEVRVGAPIRSADWVMAEYGTMADPAFAVYGEVELLDGSVPVITLNAINVKWNAADIRGSIPDLAEQSK